MSKVGQLLLSSGGFVQGGDGGWGLKTGVWSEGVSVIIILLFLSLYDRHLLWVGCSWYKLVSLKELRFQNAFESSSFRVFWNEVHEEDSLARGCHLWKVWCDAASEVWSYTLYHLLSWLLIFRNHVFFFLLRLKLWTELVFIASNTFASTHKIETSCTCTAHCTLFKDSPRP